MATGPLFSVEIDWQFPFSDRRAHRTLIATFHSGREQRIRTRAVAQRHLVYKVTTLDERESSLVEALIHGGQSILWYVPVWPYVRLITANLSMGATSIGAEDIPTEFSRQKYAMLYSNSFLNEMVQVSSVVGSTLTTSATTKAWTAGKTRIVPVVPARISPEISGSRTANFAREMDLDFEVEVWNAD